MVKRVTPESMSQTKSWITWDSHRCSSICNIPRTYQTSTRKLNWLLLQMFRLMATARWTSTHMVRPNLTWLSINNWIHIYIKEAQPNIKSNKTILMGMSKWRVTGQRSKIKYWPKLSEPMGARTGRRLLKAYRRGLMSSVCIDGKKYWIQLLWKVLGLILKIDYYSI